MRRRMGRRGTGRWARRRGAGIDADAARWSRGSGRGVASCLGISQRPRRRLWDRLGGDDGRGVDPCVDQSCPRLPHPHSPLLDGNELCRLRPFPQLPISVVPSSVLSITAASGRTARPLPFLTRPGSLFPLESDPLRNRLVGFALDPWNADVAADVDDTDAEAWWVRCVPTVLDRRSESASAAGGPVEPKPPEEGPRGWRTIVDTGGVVAGVVAMVRRGDAVVKGSSRREAVV